MTSGVSKPVSHNWVSKLESYPPQKESNCPKAIRLRQSPNQPMQRNKETPKAHYPENNYPINPDKACFQLESVLKDRIQSLERETPKLHRFKHYSLS